MAEQAKGVRGIGLSSTSLRSVRARALAPRFILYFLVGVLCIAGLRAALAGPAESAPPPAPVVEAPDLGAQAFAEGFARVYLSWDADHLDGRQEGLSTYLADGLDDDGGLSPGDDSSQEVIWTTVIGSRAEGPRTLVTIAAQTGDRLIHLTVPVARDDRGFLTVADYPAFVGPPATSADYSAETEDEVEEPGLRAVVERAVTNYLGRSAKNLQADLTPGAVVSLPAHPLRVVDTSLITWADEGSRVAVEVEAESPEGDTWTLRYELDVTKSDRWYVRSLQVDPTFQGGES